MFANQRLDSTLASFLGDPSFPKVAMESSRGGKIRLYQDLYMRYSRLALSHPQDRPIAIAGLEKRLIQSFEVYGGFGVLDDSTPGLLRRSLLWCRGADEAGLEEISFPASGRQQAVHDVPPPPSWSWMAYRGGIDYLDLPFDEVEWEEYDILSPWSSSSPGTWYSSDSGRGATGLSVNVRAFDPAARSRSDSRLVYDMATKPEGPLWLEKCVILGRVKNPGQPARERLHYVMIVSPATSLARRRGPVYKRSGVGYMPGHLIDTDQPAELARVF